MKRLASPNTAEMSHARTGGRHLHLLACSPPPSRGLWTLNFATSCGRPKERQVRRRAPNGLYRVRMELAGNLANNVICCPSRCMHALLWTLPCPQLSFLDQQDSKSIFVREETAALPKSPTATRDPARECLSLPPALEDCGRELNRQTTAVGATGKENGMQRAEHCKEHRCKGQTKR